MSTDRIVHIRLSSCTLPLVHPISDAKEIAPALIGEDPNDMGRLWNKLC